MKIIFKFTAKSFVVMCKTRCLLVIQIVWSSWLHSGVNPSHALLRPRRTLASRVIIIIARHRRVALHFFGALWVHFWLGFPRDLWVLPLQDQQDGFKLVTRLRALFSNFSYFECMKNKKLQKQTNYSNIYMSYLYFSIISSLFKSFKIKNKYISYIFTAASWRSTLILLCWWLIRIAT